MGSRETYIKTDSDKKLEMLMAWSSASPAPHNVQPEASLPIVSANLVREFRENSTI